MFALKRPCVNCPFRKGIGETFQLSMARLKEIKRGTAFQCHHTVDYEHFDDPEKRSGDRPQQCAGLMAVLFRDNATNSIMQVAERLAGIDFTDLDPDREAYDTWTDVIKAHRAELDRQRE